jgi:hypothetical protein
MQSGVLTVPTMDIKDDRHFKGGIWKRLQHGHSHVKFFTETTPLNLNAVSRYRLNHPDLTKLASMFFDMLEEAINNHSELLYIQHMMSHMDQFVERSSAYDLEIQRELGGWPQLQSDIPSGKKSFFPFAIMSQIFGNTFIAMGDLNLPDGYVYFNFLRWFYRMLQNSMFAAYARQLYDINLNIRVMINDFNTSTATPTDAVAQAFRADESNFIDNDIAVVKQMIFKLMFITESDRAYSPNDFKLMIEQARRHNEDLVTTLAMKYIQLFHNLNSFLGDSEAMLYEAFKDLFMGFMCCISNHHGEMTERNKDKFENALRAIIDATRRLVSGLDQHYLDNVAAFKNDVVKLRELLLSIEHRITASIEENPLEAKKAFQNAITQAGVLKLAVRELYYDKFLGFAGLNKNPDAMDEC